VGIFFFPEIFRVFLFYSLPFGVLGPISLERVVEVYFSHFRLTFSLGYPGFIYLSGLLKKKRGGGPLPFSPFGFSRSPSSPPYKREEYTPGGIIAGKCVPEDSSGGRSCEPPVETTQKEKSCRRTHVGPPQTLIDLVFLFIAPAFPFARAEKMTEGRKTSDAKTRLVHRTGDSK